MFLLVHTAAGFLVSQNLTNPLSAFILGLVFHYLLDIIPHGDEELDSSEFLKIGFLRAIAIDIPVACFFIFIVFNRVDFLFPQAVAWGVFGSILPDIISGFSKIFKSKISYSLININKFFHQIIKTKINLCQGLIVQTVFFILFLISLFL